MRFSQYYQSIMPDVSAFNRIAEEPLPSAVWLNHLKAPSDKIISCLKQSGYQVEPMRWTTQGVRLDRVQTIGRDWTYLSGLLQIQEEVSMLPGVLLGAKPGELILDLCAAPGNKTAQLSIAMQNTGTLIANDMSYGRLRALGQISKRLGLMNVITTNYPAQKFPLLENQFDRVLADVPCGCEGTFRKNPQQKVSPNRSQSLKLAEKQKAILRHAIRLCKPGGRILYSTCTFAPEENEAVVSAVLKRAKGLVKVLPLELPNFVASPGITQWQDDTYLEEVKHCMRVWPHQNNTGGFFLALLEKQGESNVESRPTYPNRVAEFQDYLKLNTDWFGIPPTTLDRFCFAKTNHKGFYFCNPDMLDLEEIVQPDASGLFFMKTNTRYPKITTAAAMMLYPHATQNTIALTKAQRDAYYGFEEFLVEESQLGCCKGMGFVLLSYDDVALGMGLYRPARDGEAAKVQSLFPKYLQGGC